MASGSVSHFGVCEIGWRVYADWFHLMHEHTFEHFFSPVCHPALFTIGNDVTLFRSIHLQLPLLHRTCVCLSVCLSECVLASVHSHLQSICALCCVAMSVGKLVRSRVFFLQSSLSIFPQTKGHSGHSFDFFFVSVSHPAVGVLFTIEQHKSTIRRYGNGDIQ